MKTVAVIGYKFDCLPGHVQISARGSGGTLRTAVCAAVRNMFKDPQLRRKHIGEFGLSVAVVADAKTEQ